MNSERSSCVKTSFFSIQDKTLSLINMSRFSIILILLCMYCLAAECFWMRVQLFFSILYTLRAINITNLMGLPLAPLWFGNGRFLTWCVSRSAMSLYEDKKALRNVNIRGYITPTQSHRNRRKYRYKTILYTSYP